MNKTFALVGQWGWYTKTGSAGITVCEYQENGEFKKINNYFPSVKVGSPVIKSNKDVLYFVDEECDTDDIRHEGGYIYSAKFNKGNLELINRIKTHSTNPCFITMDEKQEYLLVCHHASGRSFVSQMYKDDKGKVCNRVLYDDAAIELIEINEDGSIGDIVDYDLHAPLGPEKRSFIHGIFKAPKANVFFAVDKGLNRLYSYTINYENKKLVALDTIELTKGSSPKYIGFVPNTDYLYVCYEIMDREAIVRYDSKTGKLEHIKDFFVQVDKKICGSQEFAFIPEKNLCYIAFMEWGHKLLEENPDLDTNALALSLNNSWSDIYHVAGEFRTYVGVYDISDPLNPVIKQCISSQAHGNRGLGLSPDNKNLFVFNTDNNYLTWMKVEEDGLLSFIKNIEWSHPENIAYFEVNM